MSVTATAPRAAPAVTESPASDLLERLIAAATAAILDERQALTYDQDRVKGIHIELELTKSGAVIEGRAWIERKTRPIRGDRPLPAGRG